MYITCTHGIDTVIDCSADVISQDWLGSLLVTTFFGVSGQWWKGNHNLHHVITNSVDYDPDIQHLPFMAITEKIFQGVSYD